MILFMIGFHSTAQTLGSMPKDETRGQNLGQLFFFFSFMDSFVFEQQVLFRVNIHSVTSDLTAQYPKGWTSDQSK